MKNCENNDLSLLNFCYIGNINTKEKAVYPA
jgi:hypothetical protein